MTEDLTSLESDLDALFSDAAARAFGPDIEFDATVRPSKHADFQVNGALTLAKQLNKAPREIAVELVEAVDKNNDLLESYEVAGPGFINCTIKNNFLSDLLLQITNHERLGIAHPDSTHTYVIDYAAPNIAKNMHVGHLRTSIIGDAFVRMLEAKGQTVLRQDHQGDWGTQFGMLIEYLVDTGDPEGTANAAIHDLDTLYRNARTKFDSDEDFARRARERVVLLQGGDESTLALWNTLITTSRKYFAEVYERLGLLLTEDDIRGESFYNDMLDGVVQELIDKGLAKEDQGALCVYPEGFKGRDGEQFAMIIRKSDGGYNYATTDLATLRYSVETLHADRLLYVTDVRQADHFNMVFAVCRAAGWLPENVEARHIGYGTVLGPDGKPFKTRSGETVQLILLLDEAVERADKALSERTTDLSDEERHRIARSVGIGAVKWADLKNEHTNNYVFDLDRMLAFNGNTGPYVQYASTRAKSVLRRAENTPPATAFLIEENAERSLALTIAAFPTAVDRAIERYEPHQLANYLYELAEAFTSFYEHCPVLSAESDEIRSSRLALCALSASVLDAGLDMLGIDAVDHM